MLTYDQIAQAIIDILTQDIGVRETDGNNRSPEIDVWNKAIGVPLGSPYCTSGPQYRLHQLAAKLDLKLLLPYSAGSQDVWWDTDDSFKCGVPGKGRIAIFVDRFDAEHGHYTTCTGGFNSDGITFPTLEYNTNGAGSRDGEGVMLSRRSVYGSAGLKLQGFIDLPKMFVAP